MKEHGFLFKGNMVRAILEDRKTHTRRPITFHNSTTGGLVSRKAWSELMWDEALLDNVYGPAGNIGPCWHVPFRDIVVRVYPRVRPGDVIWVREAHRLTNCECTEACRGKGHVWYEADQSGYKNVSMEKLRPSIHMPRWASRIDLNVLKVRSQRIQEISAMDVVREGIMRSNAPSVAARVICEINAFNALWNSINAARGFAWKDNHPVWIYVFKRKA